MSEERLSMQHWAALLRAHASVNRTSLPVLARDLDALADQIDPRPKTLREQISARWGDSRDDIEVAEGMLTLVQQTVDAIPWRGSQSDWRRDVMVALGMSGGGTPVIASSDAREKYIADRAAEKRASCTSCGLSDSACTRHLMEGKDACCPTCHTTDTHPKREPF